MIPHGDAADSTIPLGAFKELVAQYHHRLLCLEAELKDEARSRRISASGFDKRVKQLQTVQKSLSALQRLCLAETPGRLTAIDIGLPLLDDCTPDERAVCEQFLAEKSREVAHLEEETAAVYDWLAEGITGGTGPVRLTLRLSKLRRMIQHFEKRSGSLEEAAATLSTHVDRLLASLKGVGRAKNWTTIDGLMRLFEQLDGMIARVARLRATVKHEETETQAMAAWLQREEAAIRATRTPIPPPSPLATTRATLAVAPPSALPRERQRRQVLEQFWDEIMLRGLRAPTHDALAAAATLLGRRMPTATTGKKVRFKAPKGQV